VDVQDALDTQDDRALMAGIAAREKTALETFYDRHAGQVMALCLRILRDRAEAEEVLGDVFWELWDRADRYRHDRGAPVAYVMTVARSRAIDRLRRRRPEVTASAVETDAAGAPAPLADAPSADPGPFHAAAAAERRTRIRVALATLSEAERRAVELSFFDGLSHGEIARALREPLGTVKSRIRQGLLRLRDALGDQYGTMGAA